MSEPRIVYVVTRATADGSLEIVSVSASRREAREYIERAMPLGITRVRRAKLTIFES